MATSSISQTKAYRSGTHRATAPQETVARLEPLMPAFGISRVANLTGLDRVGVPIVMVCRPNSRSSAVFHGKGIDLAAAKASGLMEAIETWHAEHVQLPLRLCTQSELSGAGQIVDTERLPRRPSSRFHPHLAMLWVEGHDLIGGAPVWVPFEIVHANATGPELPGSCCFAASTNGLASGNAYMEAVSHALCEVIERDATSVWHRLPAASQRDRRVALETVDDVSCSAVLDRIRRAGLDLGVWETTTDVGIPAFQCLVTDRAGPSGHVGEGAGCHPAREVALLRALTEAVQVRMTYIVGSREDIRDSDYLQSTLDNRRRRANALIRSAGPKRDFKATPRHDFLSFEEEVAWILRRLKEAGIRQAIAVDLTRPEFEVSVVRVVVPGLEGSDHHADYVPGPRAQAAMAGVT
jgi:YcaO-like protein with predicted kinase domain